MEEIATNIPEGGKARNMFLQGKYEIKHSWNIYIKKFSECKEMSLKSEELPTSW